MISSGGLFPSCGLQQEFSVYKQVDNAFYLTIWAKSHNYSDLNRRYNVEYNYATFATSSGSLPLFVSRRMIHVTNLGMSSIVF